MNKVKDLFVGWYDYPKEEFEDILKNGVISFDTNVLLNLYRYSTAATNETLDRFEKIKDRLIFSYYVAYEFTKNRKKTECDSINKYNKFIESIEKKYDDIINEISQIANNKLPNKTKIVATVTKEKNKNIKLINNEVEKKKKIIDEGLEDKICSFLDNRILDNYSPEEFEEIKKEGIRRIKEQIPPGYKDSEKKENGDYHIFKQLIDYSKKENKNIVFVTDDVKEDMFQEYNGIKTPRPELLQEFFECTGHKIIIMTPEQFLKNKIIFKDKISDDIIDEIKSVSFINSNYNLKTQYRTQKLLYRAFKYETYEDIETNIDTIVSSLKTLVRIYEGNGDVDEALDIQNILWFLKQGDINSFISSSSKFRNEINNKKDYYLTRIKYYYNNLNAKSNYIDILDAFGTFVNYIDCFMDDKIENNDAILKLRKLRNSLNHGLISVDYVVNEFNLLYEKLFDYSIVSL